MSSLPRKMLLLAVLLCTLAATHAGNPPAAGVPFSSGAPVEVGKDYVVGFPKDLSGSDSDFPVKDVSSFRILAAGPMGWFKVAYLMPDGKVAANEPTWVNLQYALTIRELPTSNKNSNP